MPELDEQLRRYLDATAPAVDADPTSMHRSDAEVLILLEDHPKHRARSPRVLVAAVVIAVAGLAGAALLWTGDGTDGTETDPVEQPDPPPVESSTAELVWTKSSYTVPDSAVVVIGDGAELFVIGAAVDSSVDGLSWARRDIADMPSVESLTGDWTASDAASGKVVHLVINNGEARTFLFDVDAGLVDESVIVPPWATEDLSGTIAVNDDGEAVVWLFDLADRNSVPTAGFYLADGSEWSPIDADQLPTGVILSPVALEDEFVAVRTWPGASPTYWHSPDGREWSAVEAEGTLEYVEQWGNTVVAHGSQPGGYEAYGLTAAAGTELDLDLSPLRVFGFYPEVAAGGIGFAAVSPTGHLDGLTSDGSWFIDHSSDGVTWVRQTLPFGELNSGDVDVSVNTEQVLVRANREIWVGTRLSQPVPDPTDVEIGPVDTTPPESPTSQDAGSFNWVRADRQLEPSEEFLAGDGERLFLLGVGTDVIEVSTDGHVWEPLTMSGAPEPDQLHGLWRATAAEAGRVVRFVVSDNIATVFLFDTNAGEVSEAVLPFSPAVVGGEVRGSVAVNREGELVAVLYGGVPADDGSLDTAAFHSSDGSSWTPVTDPDLPVGEILNVAALGDGFVITVGPGSPAGPTSEFWHSPDGVDWSARDAASPLPGSLITWGEVVVAYQSHCCEPQSLTDKGNTHVLTVDGATSLVIDLPSEGGEAIHGPYLTGSSLGLAAFAPVTQSPVETWIVEYTTDGEHWTREMTPLDGITDLAAGDGRIVVHTGGALWVGERS